MARLVVLRGETVDRKIDLVKLPVTIGRGQKNDVVLEDPMKGVSRNHAEIRLVNGRHVLVDLESENGIWVTGRRVSDVTLEPNVVASIGPFRLAIEDVTSPILEQVTEPAARPAAPISTAAAKPAPPKSAPRPAARSSAPADPNQRNLMIGGAVAAVAILGLVAAVVLWPDSPAPDQTEAPKADVTTPIADAERQMSQGFCKEAVQTIELALQQYPAHADLLNTKRRAEAECVAPGPVLAEPVPDVVTEIRTARTLFEARECRGALLRVSNVLLYEPGNAEAEELRKQAAACPPLPIKATDQLAKEIPPDQGGLPVQPNELDRNYQARVKAMRARYDEVMAALAKGVNPSVIESLDALLRETSPDYLDVNLKLTEARKAWLGTARGHVTRSRNLEAKESFDDAIAALKEAKAIDPGLAVDVDIARIEKSKLERGEEECKMGVATYNYRPSEAIEHFRRALRWLPPSHSCYATAQKYAGSPGP